MLVVFQCSKAVSMDHVESFKDESAAKDIRGQWSVRFDSIRSYFFIDAAKYSQRTQNLLGGIFMQRCSLPSSLVLSALSIDYNESRCANALQWLLSDAAEVSLFNVCLLATKRCQFDKTDSLNQGYLRVSCRIPVVTLRLSSFRPAFNVASKVVAFIACAQLTPHRLQ